MANCLFIPNYSLLSEEDRKIELWKDLPGWVGLYRVSTHGRVKSMGRLVKMKGVDKVVHPLYLKFATDKDGYYSIQLSVNGEQKNERVHRLVAYAFIPNPFNYPLINHIDNDVTNNHVWNLEWGTPLSNLQHSARQGRKIAPNRKLTISDAIEIRSMYEAGGVTMDKLASIYNVTRTTIGYIINNKTYAK